MENTAHSSMASSFFSDERSAATEESGWTTYIDYFMASQQQEASPSTNDGSPPRYSSDHVGGSTSSGTAEWRLPSLVEPSDLSKKLCFKKRKGRKPLYDDSLEDTATSPISSPKLNDLSHLDVNQYKKKEDASPNKIAKGEEHYNSYAGNTSQEMSDTYECTNELRKKGLCLVPVPMFHRLQ